VTPAAAAIASVSLANSRWRHCRALRAGRNERQWDYTGLRAEQ
jgi:hypothetical protein